MNLELAAIETAPVRKGKSFGPCLLWAAAVKTDTADSRWVIGHWDGRRWRADEGYPIAPVVWAALPPLAV